MKVSSREEQITTGVIHSSFPPGVVHAAARFAEQFIEDEPPVTQLGNKI